MFSVEITIFLSRFLVAHSQASEPAEAFWQAAPAAKAILWHFVHFCAIEWCLLVSCETEAL